MRIGIPHVLVMLLSCISLNLYAQVNHQLGVGGSDLDNVKRRLQLERDAIFLDALSMTVSEVHDFHPIYVEYAKEKKELDDALVKLMVFYLDNYRSAEVKFMHRFTIQSDKYQRAEQKLRKRYFKKISKEVSLQVASEFYELDDFCCAVLRLNVLSSLPFTAKFLHQ
jgi:hypothetical protein